jgi:WD40 repeat protein
MSQRKSRFGIFLVGLLMVLLLPARRCEAQEPNLEALWADLAGADASNAYRAIWALALTPEKAVPFLQVRLQPASGDRKQIDKLIHNLESDAFAERERATVELERLSDAAEEALRLALQEKPALELKRRIELLLARIPEPAGSPALVRQERALEALELAGTPEAQALVKRLADGSPAARWTRMAKAADARLAGRPRLADMPVKKVDEFGDQLPPGTLARLGTIRMQNGYWAAITSDGKSLVTVSDKSLHMWDMTTGRALPGFPQTKDWPETRAVAVSPDGKLVGIAYNRAYSFDICELPSGRLLHQRRGNGETREPCQYTVAFSADSKTFVITDQSITQLWDMTTGAKLRDFSHTSSLSKAAISADSRRLTTTSHFGPPRIWDVANGKLLHNLGDQKIPVYFSMMNADGSKLASYGPGPSARIWNGVTGKLIHQIPLASEPMHGDPTPSFAFSPDGTTLGVVDCMRKGDPEQRIQMWSLANLDLKPRLLTPPPGIGRLEAFTPDGKTLLWRSGSSYRLLDSATGKDQHGWASPGRRTVNALPPPAKTARLDCGTPPMPNCCTR